VVEHTARGRELAAFVCPDRAPLGLIGNAADLLETARVSPFVEPKREVGDDREVMSTVPACTRWSSSEISLMMRRLRGGSCIGGVV
jgi:hypothetical protein